MIGEHCGLAEEASPKSDTGRIELRQMQLDDIVLSHKFGSYESEGRSQDTFADTRRDRHADNFDAIQYFFTE